METLLDSNNLIHWMQSIFDVVDDKGKHKNSSESQSNDVSAQIDSKRKESVSSASSIPLRSCLSSSKSPSPKCKKSVKFASGDAPWSDADLARRLDNCNSQHDCNRVVTFDKETAPKRPSSPIMVRNSLSPEPGASNHETSQQSSDAQNLAMKHALMARSIAGNMNEKPTHNKPRRHSPERSSRLLQGGVMIL